MDYLIHLLVLFVIFAMWTSSLNIMIGYGGMASLSHAAMYGVGAYAAAALAIEGIDAHASMLLVSFVGGVIGWACGHMTNRFRGDHFILATLALQLLATAFFYEATWATGGASGIVSIPRPESFGFRILSPIRFLFWILPISGIVIALTIYVGRSPFANVLELSRDSESAAAALGKNTKRLRVVASTVAGAGAAVAGASYAIYSQYIDPTTFSVEDSILVLSLVVIGGSATSIGPILGAAFGIGVPEMLRFVELPPSMSAHIQMIVYGTVIVLLMHFRPQGIAGRYRYD